MTELVQTGISGWAGLVVILVVTLVAAWRMIVYANSSADSPYVEDIMHEVSNGGAGHETVHH